MSGLDLRVFNKPDEIRELPLTKIEVVNLKSASVMLSTFSSGWKWSECVKPDVGTDSCLVSHIVYVISGRMVILMDDGEQKELTPGVIAEIPPGHDAWVVGDESCVMVDFSGGKNYGVSA